MRKRRHRPACPSPPADCPIYYAVHSNILLAEERQHPDWTPLWISGQIQYSCGKHCVEDLLQWSVLRRLENDGKIGCLLRSYPSATFAQLLSKTVN